MLGDGTPVLVTAIGGGGHGEQILKALRRSERKYFVVGADASESCPQFGLCDEAVLLPLANAPNYLDAILEVIRRFKIRVVFHGCEPELRFMSGHRDHFAAAGALLPINKPDVIELCMDKERTTGWLRENGFDTPRYMKVTSPSQADMIDFYPVVVKPSVGGGGSRDTFVVQTPREFEMLTAYLSRYGEYFLAQEYVGTYKDEFTVGVLHDLDGRYLNTIAVKRFVSGGLNVRTAVKNLTGRCDLGEYLVISSGVSHGQIGRFPEVTDVCREIARRLDVRGALNIQCRYVNGRVIPFEINPRFSGTTSLRAMVGYNEPDALIGIHLFGETVEPDFPYREATIIRTLIEHELKDRPILDLRNVT